MTAPTPGSERLNRFLARRGVASRRGADALIGAGRVRVNGGVAQVGTTISPGADAVSVDGVAVAAAPPRAVTVALNKPPGVITTMRDPHGRPTVRDIVPATPGLVPVGRLDANSRGLLLLSSDGDLAHRVAHPRHGVNKIYRVRTAAPVSDTQLDRLRSGVALEDGPARALEARRLDDTLLEVVMGEGRKRVVRRMVAATGNSVVDLCRTAVGPIQLAGLEEGSSRFLDEAEVRALSAAAMPSAGRAR